MHFWKQHLGMGLLAAILTACGGSDGNGSPTLSGALMEVNGQTVDRGNVRVTVVETGETIVTGADGRFDFGDVPEGTVTLRFDSDDSTEGDEDESSILEVEAGEDLEIRCSFREGKIESFVVVRADERKARRRLELVSATTLVEGKIEIESKNDGDQSLEIEVESLLPGDVVEIFFADPLDPGTLVSFGTATADAFGEAELEIETENGQALPFGVALLADLEGITVEVRRASDGEVLLRGEFPGLPDLSTEPGDEAEAGERGRGRAELQPVVAGLEGHVEIRSRPEQNEERFKMEAGDLAAGQIVTFEIEDPANPGTFVALASGTADAEGEAQISTQDGLAMPLGVSMASDLVGLEVRVLDDGGQTLLTGIVPPLLAD